MIAVKCEKRRRAALLEAVHQLPEHHVGLAQAIEIAQQRRPHRRIHPAANSAATAGSIGEPSASHGP